MKTPLITSARDGRSRIDPGRLVADILAFLGEDEERFTLFLTASGLDPSDLRRAAASPTFGESLLDHLCGDERLLVAFAGERGYDPAAIERLRQSLAPPPFDG